MAGIVLAIHVLLPVGMAARAKKKIVKGRGKKKLRAPPFHPAYGAQKGMVRIMPGTDLTKPADPEWADRLDAAYGPELRKK